MRKHLQYSSEMKQRFAEYKRSVLTGQVNLSFLLENVLLTFCDKDTGFGRLMGKLKAALAVDAHENELVVK